MPELPDVQIYLERLDAFLTGRILQRVDLVNPFVLRTVDPPTSALDGRRVVGFRRLGKRIVFTFEDDLFAVLHLMIAGRLKWRKVGAKSPKKTTHAVFVFEHGQLLFTEAASKKRAALHVVRGEAALEEHDPGGVDVLSADVGAFADGLRKENHTLKRSLTSPALFSGIGNAYSDEILHRARLSPMKLTSRLDDAEIARLHAAARDTLTEWIERSRAEVGDGFPEKVTAFREGMAVHGRYRQPCPVCGDAIRRILKGESECNYCPTCQNGGIVLADRGLSPLFRGRRPDGV
ncbi:MAG: hypothetical protein KDA28_08905 [Phycisphaerales bacterium]|nr:hypothetical protein [Phycisphaerales bacterium]